MRRRDDIPGKGGPALWLSFYARTSVPQRRLRRGSRNTEEGKHACYLFRSLLSFFSSSSCSPCPRSPHSTCRCPLPQSWRGFSFSVGSFDLESDTSSLSSVSSITDSFFVRSRCLDLGPSPLLSTLFKPHAKTDTLVTTPSSVEMSRTSRCSLALGKC